MKNSTLLISILDSLIEENYPTRLRGSEKVKKLPITSPGLSRPEVSDRMNRIEDYISRGGFDKEKAQEYLSGTYMDDRVREKLTKAIQSFTDGKKFEWPDNSVKNDVLKFSSRSRHPSSGLEYPTNHEPFRP